LNPSLHTKWLNRWFSRLGALTVASCVGSTLLSYGMAPVAPLGKPEPREAECFARLAQALEALGPGVQAFVTGQSPLARPWTFLLAYCVPLLLSTGSFLALLVLLGRHHAHLDARSPRLLFRWALAIVAASLLAAPVLAQDFWLSIGWGEMVVRGLNPYYVGLPPDILSRLPLDHVRRRMTYGPLWGVISAAVVWGVGEHFVLAALVFKCALAAAWSGTLWLVWSLLRGRSLWHQCAGLAVFGWMPLSGAQTIAEGHNDVFMVAPLLLWLAAIERDRPMAGSMSLAASAVVKYVTAPLFVLDALHLRGSRGRSLWSYLPQAIIAAGLMVAVLAFFYRSPEFFAPMARMARWRFFTPSNAVLAVGKLVGLDFRGLALITLAVFPVLAVASIVRYRAEPSTESFRTAVLALMCAMLFSAVGHVWPWFVLWALAPAALVPSTALGRWVIGVALASPFPLLMWRISPASDHFYTPSLVMYTAAVLWFVLAPRRWFPA
jgi:alpha-1,6-mannosyltransferase